MKVLFINTTSGQTSTGRICAEMAEQYMREGHTCRIAYGRDPVPEKYQGISIRVGDRFSNYWDALYTRITDRHGFSSPRATKKFLEWATDYDPNLLWLHNLHGYYINIEELFAWIKERPQMKVMWMLHDCWAITGHCGFFSMIGCDRWKTGCNNCPQKTDYPASILMDSSKWNYENKKRLFTGVTDMTLVTPSQWLADIVRQSYLKEYPVEVRYHSIDMDIFKPTLSNFRAKHHLQGKIMVLGVANVWHKRKGLNDFIELSKRLDDRFAIVLIGLTAEQIKQCPIQILGLPRTSSARELAEVYSAADVYVNPSREETFGLTTTEAIACGTPAIVYCDTACEEIINRYGGVAVPQNVDALYEAIVKIKPKV